ncbi:MAG: ATP-binding protein [Acidobacteriota bacterium]
MAKFEVQARVIDLLGMQQIADCPTAISELFKNAYDAYAHEVKLDAHPEEDRAILWDTGVGMTESQLLHRWLVVGASGKKDLRSSLEPPDGMEKRPIQGEKGIGRLAISTLGDTLLLISRSYRSKEGTDPYTALLINWNLVRNERLLLSDIEIPTITFSDLDELDTGIVDDMVDSLRKVVHRTETAWQTESEVRLRDTISNQLDSFSVDLSELKRVIGQWKKNRGTLFYIRDLVAEFRPYLEKPSRNDELERHPHIKFLQLLSNFDNTFGDSMREESGSSDFTTDIRRFDTENQVWRSFFATVDAISPDDLRVHDHFIDVEFDSEGRYRGKLEIYGELQKLPHPVLQPRQRLSCGPFRLRLWYIQGRESESQLEKETWRLIKKKLDLYGGLMIYRDGLRVLPYGNPEWDWLHFEERRSRSAIRYHFSYRRMFGYVAISGEGNPKLIDKAGREGLIQNAAYRDLRKILMQFFSDVALEHFKKEGHFRQTKEGLKAKDVQLKAEKKRVNDRRKKLFTEAHGKITFISKNGPEQLETLLNEGLTGLKNLDSPGPPEIAKAVTDFTARLARTEGQARIRVPADLSLGRDTKLKKALHDHEIAVSAFSQSCMEIRRRFTEAVRESWPEAEEAVSARNLIDNAHKQALARLGRLHSSAHAALEDMQAQHLRRLKKIYTTERSQIERALLAATHSSSVEEARRFEIADPNEVLGALNTATNEAAENLEVFSMRQLSYLEDFLESNPDELRKFQNDEIELLQEQANQNLELVQLGLTVEIIDHDLNQLYRGLRANIAKLRNVVRNAPNARGLTEELRAGFQHLEQRYKLMSPLYRGSFRTKSDISGARIYEYCQSFLGNSLRSVGVSFEVTEAFRAYAIHEVPAAVLPVFVNLIDNAIYWLREQDERRIVLDRVANVLTICDSGPGIHPTLLEEIFEPFVSTKPGGRGLGLYIARANLTRYHHEIWATDIETYRKLPGACICIRFHKSVVLAEE